MSGSASTPTVTSSLPSPCTTGADMEIDITHMFEEETWGFAGSVATHGPDVAKRTYDTAKSEADRLFPNVDKEDLVDHFRGYGAWSEEELEAMTLTELRAMLVQDVTNEM